MVSKVESSSIEKLILELHQAGINIWVEENRLRSRAPQGAITPALRSQIKRQKEALIDFLSQASQADQSTATTIQPTPRLEVDTIPLSFVQESLWLLEQIEPGNLAYNEVVATQIEGDLHIGAFERALATIVHRHESLRTTFSMTTAGEPFQVIHPPAFELPLHDLSHLPSDAQQTAIQALAKQAVHNPLDTEKGPLFRCHLFRLQQDDSTSVHVLLVFMHHLIGDAWSARPFYQELATLYAAFVKGNPSPLPKLPVQYADYAIWQRTELEGDVMARHLAYWEKQLANAPALLELPIDRPRPPKQTFRGSTIKFTIDTSLVESLRNLAQQNEATLFMVMLAAFNVLLARHSNQDDILVGAPIANRQQQEIESLIGFFVNTLVYRTRIVNNPTFIELLAQVKQTTQDAYTHQDASFASVVSAVQPERDLSHSPLFQAMFAFQNIPAIRNVEIAGLRLHPFELDLSIAKYDLSLELSETEQNLSGAFEYNTDLFDEITIARMVSHFIVLLEGIVTGSPLGAEKPVLQLPMLTEAEYHQIVHEWNNTAVNFGEPQTIHALFEQQVERTPDAIALIYDLDDLGFTKESLSEVTSFVNPKSKIPNRLTYAELNARANQLAHHLIELGACAQGAPDTLVAVAMERSIEMVVSLLAVLKAGGAYVPIDPTYPEERIRYMLADSAAPILLTQSYLAMARDTNVQGTYIIAIDEIEEQLALQPTENPQTQTSVDDLAYVIYTSGSTGQPKGVMIEHGSLVSFSHATQQEYQLTTADRLLQFATISFDAAGTEIYPCLIAGGTLFLRTEEMISSGQQFLQQCAAWGITVITPPTAYWHQLVTELVRDNLLFPASIRLVTIGGEKVNPRSVYDWQEQVGMVPRLINEYGPTETTIVALRYEFPQLLRNTNVALQEMPIGQPNANVTCYVLDGVQNPVPIGVVGELYIGGKQVARGYLNQPELTDEKFIANPFAQDGSKLYRTGDLVRYHQDGNLVYVGRVDEQVKIRGFRVEPGEIESALQMHPLIAEAVVLTHQQIMLADKLKTDEQKSTTAAVEDQRLVAYLVTQMTQSEAGRLREFLSKYLPDYMIPSAFVALDAFPLTPNDKLDRRALPVPEYIDTQREFVPPRTETEKEVAAIWREVLQIEPASPEHSRRVGVYDNFFALGGHSLLATQVISRVRSQLNLDIPLRSLFEASRLDDFVQIISQAQASIEKRIVRVSRDQPLPLSFAQQRLWFLNQLEPDSAFYNMPMLLRLTGQLDVAALEQSFRYLIERHESLRTVFRKENDDDAIQVIHPPSSAAQFTLSVSLVVDEQEAQHLAQIEAALPFTLSEGPLLRAQLFQIADDDSSRPEGTRSEQCFLLLLNLHHIIGDGWSMSILAEELTHAYRAYSTGQKPALPDLLIQYADFAVWQREYLSAGASGTRLERQLAYWQEELAGVPALLELPVDRPRPPEQSYRGAHYFFALDTDLMGKVNQLAHDHDATLFMVLLAAFSILLARYSRQHDIAIGSGIANRNRADIEGLIGFFVNSVVLRTQLENNPTFTELLAQVRQTTLDAYQHQDFPFEQLVDELGVERSLSYNPLIQVALVLQNTKQDRYELPNLTVTTQSTDFPFAKTDLTLYLTEPENEGGFWGIFEYATDLFDEATIARMASHFTMLLHSIVTQSEQPVLQLPMLTDSEYHQIVQAWNDTAVDLGKPQTIHTFFEQQVERTPDAIALIYDLDDLGLTNGVIVDENSFATRNTQHATRLTYRELNARANQLAHYLIELGVGRTHAVAAKRPFHERERRGADTLVAIAMERSIEMIVSLLAVLKAGGAYLPIDPAYPEERIRYMLDDSATPILLTQSHLSLAHLSSAHLSSAQVTEDGDVQGNTREPMHLLAVDTMVTELAAQPTHNPQRQISADDLAYVIYTSGSTGQPKGVMIPHNAICNVTLAHIQKYDIRPTSQVLQIVSFNFDVATGNILMTLCAGAALHLPSHNVISIGDTILQALRRHPITHAPIPVSILAALPVEKFSHVQVVMTGGEVLPANVAEKWSHDYRLTNAYGPTETTISATIMDCSASSSSYTTPPIGYPLENVLVYILDEYLSPVPVGVAGELYIGGVQLARGYLNRPELTAERFIDHPDFGRLYKTGDLCRWLPDGSGPCIEFLGRADFQVKLRGFRIELGEIEHALLAHEDVREAVVLARAEREDHKQLVAYIVAEQANEQAQTARMEQWQAFYEHIYHQAPIQEQEVDPTFDIVGWNSSYTGEAIPDEEMAEWVDTTIADIARLKPQRILEIGCGTGLLLFRLAPTCTEYRGTDYSQITIQQLSQIIRVTPNLDHVQIEERMADDFHGVEENHFDCVILNSVIQYFPSAHYLQQVIAGAIRVVKPGGTIYVGDVRNYRLLEAYYAAIQTYQAPEAQALDELAMQIQRQVRDEEELLVDPRFFYALQKEHPEIRQVEVQLKKGHHINELTQFRYQVVLYVGDPNQSHADSIDTNQTPLVWAEEDWSQQIQTLSSLEHRLHNSIQTEPETALVVRNIPNQRIQDAVHLVEILGQATPKSPEIATVHELRTYLAKQLSEQNDGIHPEALWSYAKKFPYHVYVSWSHSYGLMDAYFIPKSQAKIPYGFMASANAHKRERSQRPVYTNNPLLGQMNRTLIPKLHTALQDKLPAYMVPSLFVIMDQFPLTPNGKLDRRALPRAVSGTAFGRDYVDRQSDYVAPRTETERALAQAFMQVLGVPQMGVHDNFFRMGGDSILSIQAVSRVAQQGYTVSVKEIFQSPTIAELAANIDSATGVVQVTASQEIQTGSAPLLPIQRWFLESNQPEMNHFNQSFLLAVKQPLNREDLQAAIRTLLHHHDALRFQYRQESSGWQQRYLECYMDADHQNPFSLIDLSPIAADKQFAEIERIGTETQASLNPLIGDLVRFVYFQMDDQEKSFDRLLIVVHHLAVDGVSWRILIEDLTTLLDGGELPPKSSSYRDWGETLQTATQAGHFDNEIQRWLADDQIDNMSALPLDDAGAINTLGSSHQLSLALSQEETEQLLRVLPEKHDVTLDAVVLTALTETLTAASTGRPEQAALRVKFESYGRQELFETINLNRTVGWFTSAYPLTIPRFEGSAVKRIRYTLEQLRRVTDGGINFGALQDFHPDATVRAQLGALPQAQVVYNYLGQFDSLDNHRFGVAPESVGPDFSSKSKRDTLLDSNAVIVNGQLHIHWMITPQIDRERAEAWLDSFHQQLQGLIAEALTVDEQIAIPSDFEDTNLSLSELESLLTDAQQTEHSLFFAEDDEEI